MSYLHAGITLEITAYFFKGKPDEMAAYVDNRFGQDLFTMDEKDGAFRFSLKPDYLEPQDFANFLEHQFSIGNTLVQGSPTDTAEVIRKIRECRNQDEILHYINDSSQHVVKKYGPEYIYDELDFRRVRFDIQSLVFFTEGKIMMECYDNFMAYLSTLLQRDSRAFKCAKAARIFIG